MNYQKPMLRGANLDTVTSCCSGVWCNGPIEFPCIIGVTC